MTPIRVVICDDEPLALVRLANLLSRIAGIDLVGRTVNSQHVVTLVEEAEPDLVILDVDMPGLDGFAVAEKIGRHGLKSQPLTAFVTAHSRFRGRATELGAVGFITKPVRPAELQYVIDCARRALPDAT